MKTYAIILAGGSGQRLQAEVPKAFVKIHGRTIMEHSILPFQKCDAVDGIILVVPQKYVEECKQWRKAYHKIEAVVAGGVTRYHSSMQGLAQVPHASDKVLVHDAARPFVDEASIKACIAALDRYDAVNLLSPVSNSMVSMKEGKIEHAVDRNDFRQVLTPQAFIKKCLDDAHVRAENFPIKRITDDFNLVLHFNTGSVTWVEGNTNNIKITYPHDLKIAECMLGKY